MLGPKTENSIDGGSGNQQAGRDIVLSGIGENALVLVVQLLTDKLEAALEAKHEAEKAALRYELEMERSMRQRIVPHKAESVDNPLNPSSGSKTNG